MRYCHQHLFKSLQVQDTSKSSAWGPTGVTDKYYPLRLRSWEGFITTQQRHYDIIKDILHDEHLFPSLSDVLAIKRISSKRPVASEKDIRTFMLLALEDPVENIFDSIESRSNAHPMSREFDCAAVSFENQPYSLTESDAEEEDEGDDEMFGEDVQMGQGQSGPNQRVARDRKISRREGPDKWCFWTNHNGATKIAFPIEYKAAHKVPVEGLRQALGKEDLFAQVISTTFSGMVSADKDIRSQEQTEEMVAKALAQTFHYMIHLGTAYGILAAGKSMVFLWVRDDDPKALYYHMLEPERDAEGGDGSEIAPFYTAVAQLAAFCLRASRSPKRPDGWREGAESVLKKWPQLYPEMDYAMTDEETSTESTRSTLKIIL
ncbi:hypothetical protein TOPH_02958 [Tolypocladium ophioglossoides CBS 100239]|uniref:Uncharacterized protein n=1 Tax=Tolypocladium ophioglossoides (strain CBS 100239) TaxID=1163406 RepID=A0A0L0NDY5_TOLOC|nr:hypothetical protein TOPH_02958 [Tolypocladium ophioglossoides CBS 100239]